MTRRIGQTFQQETKYLREKMAGIAPERIKRPEAFKRYPEAETVELPRPSEVPTMTLWQALGERRSVREYSDVPLTLMELSQLVWAGQGVTARMGGYLLRTAPSAGALYPVETYVVVNNIVDVLPSPVPLDFARGEPSPPAGGRGDKKEVRPAGGRGDKKEGRPAGGRGDEKEPARVPQGVYHYDVQNHRLEVLRAGDFRSEVAGAALDQEMCAEAAVVFLWTAVFARSAWKYGERAYRYVYLDAGHIAENVALAAVALGLGSCQIGALLDDECNALVGVDGTNESTIYMTSVGRAAHVT